MSNNEEKIQKIEWGEWHGDGYYGKSCLSKCGRYERGWEYVALKNMLHGSNVYFTIDHVKGTKVGGIESIINKI
jgi:hypothetical protein